MNEETHCIIDVDEDGYHVLGCIDREPYAIGCPTPQDALDEAEAFGLEVANIDAVLGWIEQIANYWTH